MTDPWHSRSKDRLKELIQTLEGDKQLGHEDLPGLSNLLRDVVDPGVTLSSEDSIRRILKVFSDSNTDGTYSQVKSQYEPKERDLIDRFVTQNAPSKDVGDGFHMGPSLGARDELPLVDGQDSSPPICETHLEQFVKATAGIATHLFHKTGPQIDLYDDAGKHDRIAVYIDKHWQNWGQTVEEVPFITCVPRTTHGVQEIVRFAKARNMNVRASGYRHSWSPVFGKTGQIIISTLGLTQSTMLPNVESLPGSHYFAAGTELNSIEFFGAPQKGKKRLVRVGTAVTNQMFRRWCNSKTLDEASTLPLNVIMVEITLGGSNAPICHGAGRAHSTLSDLVFAIEYVDADGNMQTLSKKDDPEMMKAASGCFGLLGIVTHITLELDPMTYAVMTPQKIPLMQAIPPPPGLQDEDIPEALRIPMTPEQRADAQAVFEKHAREDFYSEWFWFPYTSMVWVNCWNTTTDSTGSKPYPSSYQVFEQFIQTVAVQVIQRSEAIAKLEDKFPWAQTTLLSKMGLYAMPDLGAKDAPIKTTLPDALHFRRAIQNVRVRDMELEIPLQPKSGKLSAANFNDDIDFSTVQKAWWDAILTAYKHTKTCPQRMPLEMRITGSSDVVMAPFRGNNLGTCSIEVLTLEVMKEPWPAYAQEVLDRWMDLKDKEGNYLSTRPHWAKEWHDFQVRGQSMIEYLKEEYRDAIPEFCTVLRKIAEKQGWNIQEARTRFSNRMFDDLIFAAMT